MLHQDFKTSVFLIVLYPLVVMSASHFEGKIVGGQNVNIDQYPFAVQFFNMGAMCGGVILNSWSVITSAHCFDKNTVTSEMRIQIRARYINDFNAKRFKINLVVVHEDYNEEIPFQNDIALVFIEEPMIFDRLTKRAILVNSDKWMNKKAKFTVTGWGWTKYGGDVSKLGLLMTYLKYVPREECRRLHNLTKLTPDMFCLYGDGVRDTCKGDSGGGVLWNGMIVGLTSHGDGCAKKDKPSVYTSLWVLRNWIRTQTFKFINEYCAT